MTIRMGLLLIFLAMIGMPVAAQAYLVPLIGAGGLLLTMLTGFLAVVCAALFLIIYNIRRAWRRMQGHEENNLPSVNDSDH